MAAQRAAGRTDSRGERGLGVLSVLALMLVLDLLLLVAARMATTAITSTVQDQSTTSAFHAAEAGLNHLMFAVNKNPDYNTGEELPADGDGDGRPDFGAAGERGWVLEHAATSTHVLNLTSGETVYLKPNQAGGVRGNALYAVGYTPSRADARATRVVKVVYSAGVIPNVAVLTEGNLVISGNANVIGLSGSVHSNTNLTISGSPTIANSATATGTYSHSGNPAIGGQSGDGRPRMRMPVVAVAVFRLLADYELRANGKVYAGLSGAAGIPGTELADTSGGTPYRGWLRSSSSPVMWSYAGNTAHPGTYFIEGNAVVSGDPGGMASPWRASIFATESIEISGSPIMTAETEGFALVAGGDLKINGSPTQRFTGALLAREQLQISGNPTIGGYVVATNAASASTLVTGDSVLSGNATIAWNGGGPGVPGGFTVDRWQELVSGRF